MIPTRRVQKNARKWPIPEAYTPENWFYLGSEPPINVNGPCLLDYLITGWAVAQTCCISQCAKYRKSGVFGYRWEQNPWTDRHETWCA